MVTLARVVRRALTPAHPDLGGVLAGSRDALYDSKP